MSPANWTSSQLHNAQRTKSNHRTNTTSMMMQREQQWNQPKNGLIIDVFLLSTIVLLAISPLHIYSFHIQQQLPVVLIDSTQRILSNAIATNVQLKHSSVLPTRRHKVFASGSDSDNNNPTPTTATATTTTTSESSSSTQSSPLPPSTKSVFDGKRVLPYKIVLNGLKNNNNDQRVAGVYAIYNSNYIRGTDGWDTTTYVGVTQDVATTIQSLYENDTTQLNVAHVRILSFAVPSPNAMQDIANQWRENAIKTNAPLQMEWANDVLNYLYDNDDDNDDEDDDEFMTDMEMMGSAMAAQQQQQPLGSSDSGNIISPFASNASTTPSSSTTTSSPAVLDFTAENVDKVLNEVRPYLIADGGNVAVVNVDEQEQIVYLQLQGACGSCASSTITMQMGIERVPREKFPSLKEVKQVEESNNLLNDDDYSKLVQEEINRILPAISAMGGTIQLQSVNIDTGIVELVYRGSKKLQKGIELAILDIDFVKDVVFVE